MDVPNQRRFSRSFGLSAFAMVVLGIGLVAAVTLSQQAQENRSRASGTFTVGTTTVGKYLENFTGHNMVCNKYSAVSTGTLTSISAAVGSVDNYYKKYSFAVYSDQGGNPGTLIAQTGTGTLTGNTWNTLAISAPVTGGLSYWLCYNNNYSGSLLSFGSTYNNLKYSTNQVPGLYKRQTFGTWPTTFGTPAKRWNDNYSIYASGSTVTAAVQPTAVPTTVPPTATPAPTQTTAIANVIPTTPPTATPIPAATGVPTSTPFPTATIAPTATRISLNLLLHGLGKGGDSSNANSGGTANPVRPQRTVTVEVLNAQNQPAATKQGTVTYNATTGNFTGTIDLGSLATGAYTIKVKSAQFLRASVPGIVSLVAGAVTTLPATTLVSGDVNGDNTINIMDYNVIMGCYSDLIAATNCTAENKLLADLTDDGAVNQFDYNLFIRELNNRGGQ